MLLMSATAATQKKSLHHSTNQSPKNICHLNNSAVSKQISIAERTVAKMAKPPSGISMGVALIINDHTVDKTKT